MVVLVAWIIQGAVGLTLFLDWFRRRSRRGARTVISHVLLSLLGLVSWVGFMVTGALVAAWTAFACITVGNILGDVMLLGRARRIAPEADTIRRRYAVAISSILRGTLPRRVSFHALFSAVVYFTCLGVCIGATIAAVPR